MRPDGPAGNPVGVWHIPIGVCYVFVGLLFIPLTWWGMSQLVPVRGCRRQRRTGRALTGVDDRLRAIGRLTRLCAPVNSSALVAVSVPYGHDADGLPVSVQIVGGSESSILAAAECLS